MPSKVCGTWKVRASPREARASGARRVMSCPSNRTSPEVVCRSPVRQLKKVDLPAPFGPIRPRISPCSSLTEAASTALKLPNDLVRLRASRSMGGSRRGRGFGRFARLGPEPIDEHEDTARLEPCDQYDDGAVDYKGKTGPLATEQIVGNLLERHQDRRTDQRPEQQAGAAECRHDQHLDRD